MKSLFVLSFVIGCISHEAVGQNHYITASMTNVAPGQAVTLTSRLITTGVQTNQFITFWTGPGVDITGNPITVYPTTTSTYWAQYNGGFVSIIINVCSSPEVIASSNDNLCLGDSLILTASTIENATYSWSGPNEFSSNLQNPLVSPSVTSEMIGTYTVTASTPGCSSSTDITNVEIDPLPENAQDITGLSTVYQGQNEVLYSVTEIPNASSYVWTLPEGYGGTSTTNSISVDYENSANSGEISVAGFNSCGLGEGSSLEINVEPTFCNNQPQGVAPNTGGWEYHDFYVPAGLKIDSLFADYTRPGFPESEHDMAWSYCEGCTEYLISQSSGVFAYLEEDNSLYQTWINVSEEEFIGPGVARIMAPTNAGTIWNDLCYQLSPTSCIAPNPCTLNYSMGDFNCDGIVTATDLSSFLNHYGSTVE